MLKVACLPGLPTYVLYLLRRVHVVINISRYRRPASYGDRDLDFAEDYLFSPARAKQYASIY